VGSKDEKKGRSFFMKKMEQQVDEQKEECVAEELQERSGFTPLPRSVV
jgi:hypothetical protein